MVLKLAAKDNGDLEVWLLSKERAYFRQVLGRVLDIEVVEQASGVGRKVSTIRPGSAF